MKYNPYSNEQLQAAQTLMELILPEVDALDEAMLAFEEAVDDWDDEDAPVLAVVLASVQGEASIEIGWDNNATLIVALDALAQRWGAGLMFGSHDPDGAFTHHHTVPALLKAAAVELKDYGLTLWLYFPDDERICAFIARSEDDDLLERLSAQMSAEIEQAYDYQLDDN